MNDIYERLANSYKVASIDRDLTDSEGKLIAERSVMIPTIKPNDHMGAAMLLAILAFPENAKKRYKFVNYVNAAIVKSTISRNNPERKSYQEFINIPNKKINQFLSTQKKGAGYRLNMRFRAAYVMWQKLHSHTNPSEQGPLAQFASEAATFNSGNFPAFFTTEQGDPAVSFIKQVIWPSKPVMHIAMALYLQLYSAKIKNAGIVNMLMQSDKWLTETLYIAEVIRVRFGDWFPNNESQYLKERNKNITIDLNQTIALFPIIDAEINEKAVSDQLFF